MAIFLVVDVALFVQLGYLEWCSQWALCSVNATFQVVDSTLIKQADIQRNSRIRKESYID